MRLLVISVEEQHEIKRILAEARKRGHKAKFARVKDSAKCSPADYDALLVRAIEGKVKAAEKTAKKFLDAGKTVVDEKIARKIDRTKMENYTIFEKSGLYIPETVAFTKANLAKIKKFPSKEIVLKPAHGKRGKGIKKIPKSALESALQKTGEKEYIAQEFAEIETEYRVYVIGQKAVGGMTKETDSWIHNVYQGAKPTKTRLPNNIKKAAEKAAKAVQTEIAGVDLGKTPKGLFIIEVNRSPGFKGYESLGSNFAEKIIEYLEKKAKKP